jgi:hypothetical protein
MHEVDRHSHSLSASALDVEVGLYVLPQGLKNEGAELALNWPLGILQQTDAVVGHDNLVMVFVLVQASNGNGATLPLAEGMFEGVGQQFIDEQADRHGDVD